MKKNKMGKRITAIAMICLTIICSFQWKVNISYGAEIYDTASDEEVWDSDASHFTYTLNDDGETITIIKYTGSESNVIIPAEIDGYKVITLQNNYGDSIITNTENLNKIIVSEGIKNIGLSAFEACTKLESIKLPDSLLCIGNRSFYSCKELESISLPSSITKIGEYAFSECTSLDNIQIPDSVINIGEGAFSFCKSLTNITLPKHIKVLQYQLFTGCDKLTSLDIPDEVTTIEEYALPCFSIINLPDSITSIVGSDFGASVFICSDKIKAYLESTGLEKYIYVGSGNAGDNITYSFNVDNRVLTYTGTGDFYYMEFCADYFVKKIDLSECVITDLPTFVTNSDNYVNLEAIILPDSLMQIDNYAFSWLSNLSEISIPDNVYSIGYNTFSNCTNLTNISLPKQLGELYGKNFQNCTNLKNVFIPLKTESIGNKTFENCTSLTSVTILGNTTYIADDAFDGCENLTIYGVKGSYVEEYAKEHGISFNETTQDILYNVVDSAKKTAEISWVNKNIAEVVIPEEIDGFKIIGIKENAFSGNNITTSITLPSSLEYIGDSAFSDCTALTEITIPDSVTSIGDFTFYNCESLSELIFGDNIVHFGTSTIRYCKNLTSLRLPSCMTKLEYFFFYGCESLTEITIPRNVKDISYSILYGSNISEITVDSNNTYFDSRNNCNAIIETATNKLIVGTEHTIIPKGVTSIGEFAFANCDGLKKIQIPSTITEIGTGAFLFCDNVESDIYIPASVTSIGECAFGRCGKINSIEVDSNNKYFDSRNNCNAIIEKSSNKLIKGCGKTVIPDTVSVIGKSAFYNCNDLYNIEIPSSVKTIEGDVCAAGGEYCIYSGAFENCTSLTSVIIPGSVTSLGNGAFGGCTNLEKVTILDGVKTIPMYAFSGDTKLEKFIVPKSVTTMQDFCVDAGSNLTIYGYINSAANTYATENEINFQTIQSISSMTVSFQNENSYTYTGKTITPLISVYSGTTKLVENTDYTLSYSDNVNAGKGHITITGIGLFDGTKTIDFTINPTSQIVSGTNKYNMIIKDVVALDATTSGSGTLLYESSDKSIATVSSDGKVTAVGKGKAYIYVKASASDNYKESSRFTVEVNVAYGIPQIMTMSMSKTTLDKSFSVAATSNGPGTISYTSSNQTVATVSNSGIVTIKAAGTTNIAINVSESGQYQGSILVVELTVTSATPVIEIKDLSSYTVSGISNKTYTGSSITQPVTVKGSTILKQGTDYIVTYANNKNIGTAVVIIKGIGNYKGTIVKTFTITPVTAKLSSVVSAGSTSTKITWSAVTGASGYVVYRSTSTNGTYTAVANVTGTTYSNTGLTAGTTYYYKVRSYRTLSDGTKIYSSSYSAVKSAKPIPATSSISSVSSSGYNSAKLTWKAVSGISGYTIYRSTSANGTYTAVSSVTGTTYNNTGLTSGKTYYYKVRAYKLVGTTKVYGNYSSYKAIKPVPAKSTISATSSAVKTKVTIKWNKIAGASGYEIYRSTSANGKYSKVTTVTKGSTVSYINGGLKSGTTYYYKVRAYRTVNGVKIYGAFSSAVGRKCK